MLEKHFVEFLGPGTICFETTTKEIDGWDVEKAVEMSKSIVARYGARPFAFRFSTRRREDDELDSREVARSGRYFLGGELMTVDDVKQKLGDDGKILLDYMKIYGLDRVIRTNGKYPVVQPFGDNDVVLDVE